MLNLKKGMPEEGDILMCTVTKIHYHSVFVRLDEYLNKSGLIHISEISPGRIRNLNDYVQEGKKVICKVISVNHQKGHIDLSLRRVSTIQRRNKGEEIKLEQKAEKIIEFVAKQNNMSQRELNNIIAPKLLNDFPSLNAAFEEVSFNNMSLESKYGIDKKISEDLTDIIKQRIKLPVVQVGGKMSIVSYDSNGLEVVKTILSDTKNEYKDTNITYLGGGKYLLAIKKNDFKDAEEELKNVLKTLEDKAKDKDCEFEFNRDDSKKLK